jgi:nucleoside diphosphate kinase
MLPKRNQIAESVYEAKKIICPLGIEVEKIHACKNNCVLFCGDMQTMTSAQSVAMISTRGKRMVEMIIMLMTRTSPPRSEAGRRLIGGSCEGGMVFLHHSSTEKMVRNMKGGPTLVLA